MKQNTLERYLTETAEYFVPPTLNPHSIQNIAAPAPSCGPQASTRTTSSTAEQSGPQRPTGALTNMQSTSAALPTAQGEQTAPSKRRRNHRGGKHKKTRRKSFAIAEDESVGAEASRSSRDHLDPLTADPARPSFYRLGQSGGRNLSSASLDSEALLDHRDHPPMRARRDSRIGQGLFAARPGNTSHHSDSPFRPSFLNNFASNDGQSRRPRPNRAHVSSGGESEDEAPSNDRTPLLSSSNNGRNTSSQDSRRNMLGGQERQYGSQIRRSSTATSSSSRRRRLVPNRQSSTQGLQHGHDVNNPPSVPNSPKIGPDMGYDDVMVTDSFAPRSPDTRRGTAPQIHDQIIDIDQQVDENQHLGNSSSPPTPRKESMLQRRRTIALPAEEDVCFPVEGMSEIAEDDYMVHEGGNGSVSGQRRRRFRQWPDLSALEEWNREEKESRSDGIRAKKISEPVLVGGRLRPQKHGWHRAEEDAPYRFTYFNEEFPSTIHSQTISELLQPGQGFRELFIPDPPELSEESSDEEDTTSRQGNTNDRPELSPSTQSRVGTRHSSLLGETQTRSPEQSGEVTPAANGTQPKEKAKRYGARPTFWLDVLSPTDTEMRVISKTFGIHPLTAEDIMMQEAREKVELFRNYYFVNYRTFEQDMISEDFLEPVNMYVVVFREGVISFHFSMTPHPANVRRRIRQLKDYLILSSDWISYAIIDDITDAFAPLIQSVEDEVDDIDEAILQAHSNDSNSSENEKARSTKDGDKKSENGQPASGGGDMLRRVGEGRKKVMGLYRLLGNKADVIKGFAKRCNDHWEVAPRSEIGLYLGDIQDHILTMTSNLSHYETLLSRAHSNYLAQINIRMNERQEQTADVLGKLTVLGTIVLPMNIITGMWGMNVLVPGQNADSLIWFWSITAGLFAFGVSCFFIAKRVYGIV